MLNPQAIHNEVYDLLKKYWQNDPSFHFTFRKSNRDGRMDNGYWFYGNDEYLAVSFWTGIDWKNKTPNIIFVILLDSGDTYLEINTSDSDKKRRFINDYLVDSLKLETSGKRYRKWYSDEYLTSLEEFIKGDKIVIDGIISQYSQSFFSSIDDGIYFISDFDFKNQKEKVDQYRNRISKQNSLPVETISNFLKIEEVAVENYGPIKNILINEIPFSSQWVFLTGENGTGKTSILRAIATAICGKEIISSELTDSDTSVIRLKLFTSSADIIPYDHDERKLPQFSFPLTNGFAAYGQSRLKTNHSGLSSQLLKSITTSDLAASLFNDDSYLIDLQHQFDKWRIEGQLTERKVYITEILTDILPNLYNINFEDQIGDIPATTYVEKDHEGAEFRKVEYGKLASGLKSMVAMIGDILVRLYNQQPSVTDPSEFTGVVLIDEIDIHLHPKLQKQLVQQLTKTFPKIQFIASTHSPIPFLGAPKNSQIFRVERSSEDGVRVKRLDELIELGDLLPNTILTSPIFGLDDIVPESHDQKKIVRTEVTYSDIEFNDKVQEKIDSFLTDEKEQQLINLFKARNQ
ncbi:MAG: AAA family ATPase [Sphingobacteriales bacterium]|nr:AAA family ATPase [Sphingobacteriales bacterium]